MKFSFCLKAGRFGKTKVKRKKNAKSRPFWEKINEKKKVEKSRPFWGVTIMGHRKLGFLLVLVGDI